MAPFWQGSDWHSSMSTSQFAPLYPSAHWHWGPTSGMSVQVPPFWQVSSEHMVTFSWQACPPHPRGQWQEYPSTLLMHNERVPVQGSLWHSSTSWLQLRPAKPSGQWQENSGVPSVLVQLVHVAVIQASYSSSQFLPIYHTCPLGQRHT